ncbi:TonB-linked outer membrane protein, SusC/RagA family [Dyadobacter soli]|uniref:TonB-linked outer membrane protein, SusC/RagA family n=1 Tax=Dyadobacter soli TaxID=659014 RepID=A0A1G8CXU0_9BACT|nr:TonB-dependent receptor [Dyadobacter soli]SDH50328.1 TonB-linked outer membrane protein, SusC/RagA family [Dyadobacter soli]
MRLFFILLLIISNSPVSFAQEESLVGILRRFAATFQVTFNYDTDLLDAKTSPAQRFNQTDNPDRVLQEILKPHGIRFRRSGRVYILYLNKNRQLKADQTNFPLLVPAANPKSELTGKVTDLHGNPLPGASVLIKNTFTGTIAASDGSFRVNVTEPGAILVFTSVGYETKEVTPGTERLILVQLAEDPQLLNEMIVTGYSSEARREFTGAVSTVRAQDLMTVPSANVEQQLQGRVAGLTLITNGQPGTSSQVRIRGFGSFGGNHPLYVVDGVPTQTISFINSADIESTTVLKDAASASVYGARAAAGVIVIATKKGGREKSGIRISYNGLYGVTTRGKGLSVLSPQEQAEWTWQARRNDIFQMGGAIGPGSFAGIANGQYGAGENPVLPDYLLAGNRSGLGASSVNLATEQAKYNTDPAAGPYYLVIPANHKGTDWFRAITRNAMLMRHSLGLSGGGAQNRYYVGASYQKQDGMVINNNFDRYTLRINTDYSVGKKLRIGENLQLTYISTTGQQGSTGGLLGNNLNNNPSVSADENDILAAYRMAPIIPVYNAFGGYAGTAAPGFSNPRNPVASREAAANNFNHTTFGFGNAYLEYDIAAFLTFKSSIGGTYFSNYNGTLTRATYENSENIDNTTYSEASGFGLAWTFTNTLRFIKQFGKHEISALAGMEALNTGAGRNIGGSGINPFSTDPNYITLGTTMPGSIRQVASGRSMGNRFYSLFGQTRYIFNDRYIATAVLRRDGSSQFGAENRFGLFPAFSAGWLVSSERFMQNVRWITDLKFRVGYGKMGNSNYLSSTNQYSLYLSNAANGYDLGATNTSIESGYFNSQIGNPKARWETSITYNAGFDASFLDHKLEAAIDIWRKETRDLLYQLPIPGVVGTRASAPFVNVARMRNQGVDLTLATKGKAGKGFRYDIQVSGSFLQNKITRIGPLVPYFTAGGTRLGTPVIRNEPGHALSSFYGYEVAGLFQNKEEVASAAAQSGAAPGRFRFKDINADGRINDADRTYLGNPIPKFTGSILLKFTYKNFDLSTSLYSSLGSRIFNNQRWFSDFYPSFTGASISTRVRNSWLPNHTYTNVPIFESAANFSTNTQANSYYIENGSYARMQHLSLGFTLPKSMLRRLKVDQLRVVAMASNLFTITSYSGLDPAVGGISDSAFGIDVGSYPVTRSYSLGLTIDFN